MDYEKLGLRVGFEIHQELDTHKLFCSCPSTTKKEFKFEIKRRLRPTQSELGEIDRAALAEALKGKTFRYQITDNTCLVEMDCEPPHSLNEEALEIALQISLMLNAKPVDEIHVMRKIVIDGSNTTGFQRTALVAMNGRVQVEGLDFRIPTICLEEDAARKVDEKENEVIYRLDRLGIPLIEVATGPDFKSPEEAARAAFYLGALFRMTGRVKRGIGSIRQDINISIRDGARQEIKGVQQLELIPIVIEREVQRQLSLLQIRDELRRRGAKVGASVDATNIFRGTASKVLRKVLQRKGKIVALALHGFGGLLGREVQPGRRLGTELADHAKSVGLGGLLHSDELPGYGVSKEEVEKVRRKLSLGAEDAFVLLAGDEGKVRKAVEAVAERAKKTIEGIPEETRRALPDGNTEYMRPLPGAGRMYPETDIPPIPVTPDLLKKIELAERPEERVRRLQQEYGLNKDTAWQLAISDQLHLFEKLCKLAEPRLVASTLLETMVSLRRDGLDVSRIDEKVLTDLFSSLHEGKIAKEVIPEILRLACRGLTVEQAIKELGLKPLTEEEVRKIVIQAIKERENLIKERGMNAMKPLMGVVMRIVRGKVDGSIVARILREELQKFISE